MCELKPCPFCGGKSEYQHLRMVDGVSQGFIRCVNMCCEQMIPQKQFLAFEDWNRRNDNENQVR